MAASRLGVHARPSVAARIGIGRSVLPALLFATVSGFAGDAIDIGARRELLVDRHLLDRLEGTARIVLHPPQLAPRVENAQPANPWGNVFRVGDGFRMLVRGLKDPAVGHRTHGPVEHVLNHVLLYYETKDGIHWRAPNLGLHRVARYPAGNVIMADEFGVEQRFAAFEDKRPGVPPAERYKGIGGPRYLKRYPLEEVTRKYGPDGLRAYASPDLIHWQKMFPEPIIPGSWGDFDSQNIVFWSEKEGIYVCYFRSSGNALAKGRRSVKRTTSTDFRTWSDPIDVAINHAEEHIYTTNIEPYFRAPHLYIGLPTRYQPKRGSATDILFVTSRDGLHFERPVNEAYIRPGLEKAAWGNRANYAAYHIMQTAPHELSIYVSGGRRYTLRPDGFASIHATAEGGDIVTKPVIFRGGQLVVNYSTSAAGALAVEIQHANGEPVSGFALADCKPAHGDELERRIEWKGGRHLAALAGQPVRLRFALTEADLFAFQFN